MRKRCLAVFVLAAVMALGTAGITAMADTGWKEESGGWVYYLSNGNRAYDSWRAAADGTWRYLNGNGYMATDSWVDDENYYVDSAGIMVANNWLKVVNADQPDGYDWYYFTDNGKVVKEKWSKIGDSWYYFNDTGAMQRGWLLDDMYYCDTNGVMLTGWQKLTPPDEDDYETHTGPFEQTDDEQKWYYFNTSGKKAVPDEDAGDNIRQKKINGTYYCLDEDGAMLLGWVCVTGDESDNIADYRFVDSNGQVRVGWYSQEPPEYLSNRYDHDVEWFYFNNKGVPTVGPEEGAATSGSLKKINGNTYLFNDKGVPVYGLQKININDGDYTAYYFGTRAQSCMQKGKYTIEESGETCQYYFSNTGRGYTGVHDNYLYYMGRIQKAESGNRYEVFTIPTGNGEKNYVVNTSGRISKSTTVRDSAGTKYKTNSSGILVREDDEEVSGSYSRPVEPDWSATGSW